METRRAGAAALWMILLPTPLGAQAVTAEPAARCEFSVPMLPAPPADSVLDGYAEPRSVYEWDGGYERAHLGIGRLAVVEGTHYPWYAGVVVPLYDRPNGALVAWINRGFTEGPAGEHRAPLTGAGVVETSYEESTPIVYDRTPSGWLRIRLWPPSRGSSDPADGTIWTHDCLLALGDVVLRFQPWEARLTRSSEGWAFFRTGVPHVLREGPGTDTPRIALIGLDHELFVQEISGHWARVQVREPAWSCAAPDDGAFPGTVREGWVRWWDEDRGPWVWFPTRGC